MIEPKQKANKKYWPRRLRKKINPKRTPRNQPKPLPPLIIIIIIELRKQEKSFLEKKRRRKEIFICPEIKISNGLFYIGLGMDSGIVLD